EGLILRSVMLSLRGGPCGKDLKVKDELAGKQVKCPACGCVLTVPQPPTTVTSQGKQAPPAVATEERRLPTINCGTLGEDSLSDVGYLFIDLRRMSTGVSAQQDAKEP